MADFEFKSPTNLKNIIEEIKADKVAFTALIALIGLYLLIIFADIIAPYSSDFSDKTLSYQPPSKVFIIDENGKLSLPYTYNYVRTFDNQTMQMNYSLDRSKKYPVKFFVKKEPHKIFGLIPTSRHLFGVEGDGNLFILGTDINGRDNFSRLLYGGRVSLTIGFLALFIVFPIGMIYGGISGYFGGAVDTIMMRLAEAAVT